ncbi:hypothetical protein BDR07DRAFT_1270091 [Suillus spraguei]|nr:hypothetical protein BDR07DRAFT_1370139 [Suillus spraguei]KAG2368414.1 hypothetical protein BDR07DRAFT_1270091 [Suillus spraguei]
MISCLHTSRNRYERIIIWHFQQQKTIAEIAQLAGCSQRSIYKILTLHQDFGHARNPFARRRGKPRILNQQDLSFITSILDANPSLFLDEIQEQLARIGLTLYMDGKTIRYIRAYTIARY